MTREEAICELQEDKSLYETEVCHAGDGSPDGRLLEALDMAIDALSADAEKTYIGIDIPYGSDKGIATIFKGKDDKLILKEVKEIMSVVRCKDCRHAEHREQMPNQVYCKRDKLSTFCAAHDNDDYCKYGERQCNYFRERREP